MSTRFSQWRNTEYVGLPVDSYLQSGLIQDQRIDTELQKSSAALAEYKSLQAVGANAEAYQSQILDNIKTELEDLAKQDIKSPDAMMRMQSIVSNPEYIRGLKSIAKNTEYFKSAQKAAADYEKESGNKINATPFYKAYDQLMGETGDASQFNANRFMGMDSVAKYTEVQKEIDDVVAKMKPNTQVWDASKGAYTIIKSLEELSPERIQTAVMYEFRNRKDLQAQLQRNVQYDSYSMRQSSEARGMVERDLYQQAFDETSKALQAYADNPKAIAKKYGLTNSNAEKTYIAGLQNKQAEYDQLRNSDPSSLLSRKAIMDSALGAAKMHGYFKEGLKKTADQVVLSREHEANKRKSIDELTKLANGNTAIVDLGMIMTPDAKELDAKIEKGSYLDELAAAANIDLKKYKLFEKPAGSNMIGPLGKIMNLGSLLGSKENVVEKERMVGDIAKSWGYVKGLSIEANAEDYLKNFYRKGNHMPVAAVNNNFDSERIGKSISGISGAVYLNNILVTDNKAKGELLNKLNKGDAKSGTMSIIKTQNPALYVTADGIPVAAYRDPETNQMISYQLVGDMARGLEDMAPMMKAKFDRNYGVMGRVKPVSISVPEYSTTQGDMGTRNYTAAKVKNGSSALTMFRDANDPEMQLKGARAIYQVAQALAEYDLNSYNQEDKVKLYNKAIKIINDKYDDNIVSVNGQPAIDPQNGMSKLITVKNGNALKEIKLSDHIYIINKEIQNEDDLVNLHVGVAEKTKVRRGKGFVELGGTETENNVLTRKLKKAGEHFTNPDKYKAEKLSLIQDDPYTFNQQEEE